jgi:monovalent cation/hydrogen antiporter
MAAVVAVVIAVRMIWMLFGPTIARMLGRAGSAGAWRERVVVGWAGMRGGVSLAAALAIPLRRADGSPFPYRDVVILVAAAVIVASLLLQGVSMPWLLRRLGLKPDDHHTKENKARLKAACAALEWLNDHTSSADGEGTDAAAESVRARYEARVRRLQTAFPSDPGAGGAEEDANETERYMGLRLKLLGVERSVMLELRREGRINATLLRTLERDLDLEEARLHGRSHRR